MIGNDDAKFAFEQLSINADSYLIKQTIPHKCLLGIRLVEDWLNEWRFSPTKIIPDKFNKLDAYNTFYM